MQNVNHSNMPEALEFLINKIENLELFLYQTNKPPELLKFDRIDRIDDACQILHFSKSKIYKLTMNNDIPHKHTPTGRLIFSRKELTKWLEENIMEEKKINEVLMNIAESASRK